MPPRVDHVADVNGADLARYSKLYEFPDFVKRADWDNTFKPAAVKATVYADPRHKREQFPCHTAASTWLSALYFTEKRAEFHPREAARIQERLDRYVSFWAIKGAVDRMLARHASLYKEAQVNLPDSSFAYVWVDQSTGLKSRHLRMVNATEVKAAAEYLESYRDRFTFRDRHRMARRILEKAAQFGAGLGGRRESLERQAGMGVCDPARVVGMLEDRARLASLPALRGHLSQLAGTVRDQPRQALGPDMLVKLAELVDDVDRSLGLYGRYTDKIPRPEDVLFEATFTKSAADMAELVPLTSGKIYKKADFSRLALDDVRSLMGDDFAEEVKTGLDRVDAEKMAELVATLPRPDAELLDRLMADCNLHPQVEKAASVRQGFTQADFARFAAAYS